MSDEMKIDVDAVMGGESRIGGEFKYPVAQNSRSRMKGGTMIHPFEADRELSTGECWDGCDICGYKNCRCDELEAMAHKQQVRDTRKAIIFFLDRAARFRYAVARLLGRAS